MNVTLTPKQLLCLYSVLNGNNADHETQDELKLQISNKILEALTSQNERISQRAFSVWEKEESKKILELESDLDTLKSQMSGLKNKPPSNPGILKKKNKF